MKSIYIAGPITGVPDYWVPFEDLQDYIDARGLTALSPTWMPQGLQHWQYMRIAIAMLDVADAIVLLPGWYDSEGARLEEAYATEMGKPICYNVDRIEEFIEELKNGSYF